MMDSLPPSSGSLWGGGRMLSLRWSEMSCHHACPCKHSSLVICGHCKNNVSLIVWLKSSREALGGIVGCWAEHWNCQWQDLFVKASVPLCSSLLILYTLRLTLKCLSTQRQTQAWKPILKSGKSLAAKIHLSWLLKPPHRDPKVTPAAPD